MARNNLPDLVGVIGLEATETLASIAGGLSVRIPKSAPMKGRLSALPMPAQEALARHAGGCYLYIPMGSVMLRARRNAEIVSAYDAGASVKDLARRHGLSERCIYAILGRPTENLAAPPGGVS